MTKYAKLIKERDNFITAAIKAESTFMKALWLNRAGITELRLKDLLVCDAIKEVE